MAQVTTDVPEAVGTFLTGYDGTFEFLTSMKARWTGGLGLTPGMVTAVQKCMVRAQERAKADEPDPDGIDLFVLPDGKTFHAVPTKGGGTLTVRIDKPASGKWQGWVFMRTEPNADERDKGRQKQGGTYTGKMRGAASRITRNWLASCKRYAAVTGKCGLCNRSLSYTDRQNGLGKTCLKKAEAHYASNR